jgi:hypothetical protein
MKRYKDLFKDPEMMSGKSYHGSLEKKITKVMEKSDVAPWELTMDVRYFKHLQKAVFAVIKDMYMDFRLLSFAEFLDQEADAENQLYKRIVQVTKNEDELEVFKDFVIRS